MQRKFKLCKSIVTGFIFLLGCQTDSATGPKELLPIQTQKDIAPLPRHVCQAKLKKSPLPRVFTINTSNVGKKEDFKVIFNMLGFGIKEFSTHDLPEIQSSELAVAVHKASQFPSDYLVEDSSLSVEGADIGINVKWLLDHLPQYIGRKAELTALIATRIDNFVFVYRGSVPGKLVSPRGPLRPGFTINRFFQADGSSKTLAENPRLETNPRYLAIRAMKLGDFYHCTQELVHWDGPWQSN